MSGQYVMLVIVVVGVLALAAARYVQARPVRRAPVREPRPLSRSRRRARA